MINGNYTRTADCQLVDAQNGILIIKSRESGKFNR